MAQSTITSIIAFKLNRSVTAENLSYFHFIDHLCSQLLKPRQTNMNTLSLLLSILLIAVVITTHPADAYSTPPSSKVNHLQQQSSSYNMDRLSFLKKALLSSSTMVIATTSQANVALAAKEIDPAIKGTKADPGYQACLSQCIYDCTKPKGGEQKSRGECIPECKQKCATSKEQLMLGNPKKD